MPIEPNNPRRLRLPSQVEATPPQEEEEGGLGLLGLLSMVPRVLGGVFGAAGGPVGATTGALGEIAGQGIEGMGSGIEAIRGLPDVGRGLVNDPLATLKGFLQGAGEGAATIPSRLGRVGVEAGIGSVPASSLIKGGFVGSALRGGALSGAGEAGRELATYGEMDPLSVARAAAIGGGATGVMGKLFGALEAPPTPKATPPKQVQIENGGRIIRSLPESSPTTPLPPPSRVPSAAEQERRRIGQLADLFQTQLDEEVAGGVGETMTRGADPLRRVPYGSSIDDVPMTRTASRAQDIIRKVKESQLEEQFQEGLEAQTKRLDPMTRGPIEKAYGEALEIEKKRAAAERAQTSARDTIEGTKASLGAPRSTIRETIKSSSDEGDQSLTRTWSEKKARGGGVRGGGRSSGSRIVDLSEGTPPPSPPRSPLSSPIPSSTPRPGPSPLTPEEMALAESLGINPEDLMALQGQMDALTGVAPTVSRRGSLIAQGEQATERALGQASTRAQVRGLDIPPPSPLPPSIPPPTPLAPSVGGGGPVEALGEFFSNPVAGRDAFYKALKDFERAGQEVPKDVLREAGKRLGKARKGVPPSSPSSPSGPPLPSGPAGVGETPGWPPRAQVLEQSAPRMEPDSALPLGPTGRFSPDELNQQWRSAGEGLKKARSLSKAGRSPFGNYFPDPSGERGMSELDVLLNITGGAGGALIGGAVDDDDPLTGALTGGLLGVGAANAPRGLRALRGLDVSDSPLGFSGEKLLKKWPQLIRGNYLSSPSSLLANAFLAPWGGGISLGLEESLKGLAHGNKEQTKMGMELLRRFANPLREFWPKFKASGEIARERVARGEAGMAEGLAFDPSASKAERAFDELSTWAARQLTRGDEAGRQIITEVGYPEAIARRSTHTSEPRSGVGRTVAHFGFAKPEEGFEDANQLYQAMGATALPFRRTPVNVTESGLPRTPGLGFPFAYLEPGADFKDQMVMQGLGLGYGLGGYALGSNLDPETSRTARKMVSNFGGLYSLPANAGFLIGQGKARGDSRTAIAGRILEQGFPVPTMETPMDLAKFAMDPSLETLPRATFPTGLSEIYNLLTRGSLTAPLNQPKLPTNSVGAPTPPAPTVRLRRTPPQ